MKNDAAAFSHSHEDSSHFHGSQARSALPKSAVQTRKPAMPMAKPAASCRPFGKPKVRKATVSGSAAEYQNGETGPPPKMAPGHIATGAPTIPAPGRPPQI